MPSPIEEQNTEPLPGGNRRYVLVATLRVAWIYALFGVLWILFSDRLLALWT